MEQIPQFEKLAMVDGTRYESYGEVRTIRVRHVGRMAFPSGKILVSDAFVAEFVTDPALERTVPEGPHDVFVSESQSGENRDLVTAWVRFGDAPVAQWIHAFYEGYEPDDTYEPGFGVDSGTACIADRTSAAAVDDGEAAEHLYEALFADAQAFPHAGFHPDCDNFFACTSGIGDGFYTSFWGLDAGGEVAVLMVDFNRLRVPVYETVRVTTPLPRGKRIASFTRSGITVQTTWLPLFGPPKLAMYGGHGFVRAHLPGGPESLRPTRGLATTYRLDVPDGTELEIGAPHGYAPAQPLVMASGEE